MRKLFARKKHIVLFAVVIILLLLIGRNLQQINSEKPGSPTPKPYVSTSDTILNAVRSDDTQLLDTSNKPAILRGFVTITNYTNGNSLDYTIEDYERMKSLGANYQSIRIGAGQIGAWPGNNLSTAYLEQLDAMVSRAKQVGIYSEFKLTLYDIREFRGLQRKNGWDKLWNNKNGEQEAIISGWEVLWERYKDEPAVIGYDLLNEPEKPQNSNNNSEFITQLLNPFYQKAIDALQKTSPDKLALIQPPFGSPPYPVSVNRNNVVYAPHFYPNLVNYLRNPDFSTASYENYMNRLKREATLHNAPLFIGEYGMPWDEKNDGNVDLENKYQQMEQTTLDLFERNNLGFSRPWFADDRAGVTVGPLNLNWAAIKGKNGLQGELRSIIIEPFSSVAKKQTH